MRRVTAGLLALAGLGLTGSGLTGCGGEPELKAKTGERATVVVEAKGGTRGGLVRTQSKVAALDADVPLPLARTIGAVRWWSEERGVGFIEVPGSVDVLVKRADVVAGDRVPLLREGDGVELSIVSTDRGARAVDVTLTG